MLISPLLFAKLIKLCFSSNVTVCVITYMFGPEFNGDQHHPWEANVLLAGIIRERR